jgi:tRNA uridine 5-carboxymethylaminomethyl modification enzyme
MRRPGITIEHIHEILEENYDTSLSPVIEMEIKYEGYILRDQERIAKLKKMDSLSIPENIDYLDINGLKNEAREKLRKIRPDTVGQASRISGVDPSDISILIVYLEVLKKKEKEVPRGTI